MKQISVGSGSQIWRVTDQGKIYRRARNAWELVPGTLSEVSVDRTARCGAWMRPIGFAGETTGISFLSRDTVKATSSRGSLYTYPAKES